MSLDLNKPVRTRDNIGISTIKVVGVFNSRDHKRDMLFLVTTDQDGTSAVAYRNPDGTSNHSLSYDLVNYDTAKVARLYQTTSPTVADAIKVLWRNDFKRPAIHTMQGIDSTLNSEDVAHYFEGLFG